MFFYILLREKSGFRQKKGELAYQHTIFVDKSLRTKSKWM